MWWRKKAVPKDKQEEPPGGTHVGKRADLPFSPKDILSMVTNSKTLPIIFHLKNFISNIPIEDESGKKALEDLTVKLQLKFPVEFEFRPGESWALQYPIANVLRTDERGGFVLSLKHHTSYSERDTLVNGIYFLNGAKMVETSFPGILVEGDERKRSSFAEIAYQIKEPYFPGGDTPYFGRVYPYPVLRRGPSQDSVEFTVWRAVQMFYQQELLARMYPTPVLGGELYELNLLMTALSAPKTEQAWRQAPIRNMVEEVAIVAAESKLNYGRKWAQLPMHVSEDFERLVEGYGSTLFLEALKERYGSDKIQIAYSIISQLPLEEGRGFGPPILQEIFKVLNILYVFLSRGQVLNIEEIQSQKLNLTVKGEFGGLQGKYTLEKGPPIRFIGTEQKKAS